VFYQLSGFSRLVPGFTKAGAKEAEGAHGQPRWRQEGRMVILLFEQN